MSKCYLENTKEKCLICQAFSDHCPSLTVRGNVSHSFHLSESLVCVAIYVILRLCIYMSTMPRLRVCEQRGVALFHPAVSQTHKNTQTQNRNKINIGVNMTLLSTDVTAGSSTGTSDLGSEVEKHPHLRPFQSLHVSPGRSSTTTGSDMFTGDEQPQSNDSALH